MRRLEWVAVVLWFSLAPLVAGADLTSDEALALAHQNWFEGIPADKIERLSPDAVQALGVLLSDPAQAEQHSTALELLGEAGGDGAMQIVAGYGQVRASGEEVVSQAVHRARIASLIALARLARDDSASYEALVQRTRAAPRWRTDRMKGDRVERLRSEICLRALAMTGRPEAAAEIRAVRRVGPDPDWQRRVDDALDLHRDQAARRNELRQNRGDE